LLILFDIDATLIKTGGVGMVAMAEAGRALFGPAFTAGASALIVLALAELVTAGTGTCGTVIDMAGYTKLKLVNSTVWVSVLLIANWLLIPEWGVLGAAVASLIGALTVNLARIVEIWILERIQPYDRTFLKPLAAGLGSAAFVGTLSWLIPGDGTFAWAVVGSVLVLLSYSGLSVLLGLAPEDREVFARMLTKITGAARRRGSAAV